ncbi:MAG: hypothetical protein K0S61_4745 [Anaerocolumna sp.]|jgi:hypothetical protein|nr:hypothetical protein [Anaerocolumna sp.]
MQILKEIHKEIYILSYQYDNAVDYYAGRVTGDILSMVGGSSSLLVV